MGKGHRHSKDPMHITATEWALEYGGHKKRKMGEDFHLGFDTCALTLSPYKHPACSRDGILFEYSAVLDKEKVIKLNMAKNEDGKWMCPVTHKTFTNYSKVAAIRTTGNVYSYQALKDLCFHNKNMVDLLDSVTRFTRDDVIIIHDPEDADLVARRDRFVAERGDDAPAPSVRRLGLSSDHILATAKKNVEKATESREVRRLESEKAANDPESPQNKGLTATFLRVRQLGALTDEVLGGSRMTSGATSRSVTSSAVSVETSKRLREATDEELKTARWKVLRGLGKKGYAKLETTLGPLNFEIHCDICPRASENFLGKCANGDYDDVLFHRVVAGFMAQGGDPSGDGTGGDSLWGGHFADEFDSRLRHDKRGILAMANSGRDKNKSQFYVTFQAAPHLDNKHTIFGKLVGGFETLQLIERLPVDSDHKPLKKRECKILSAQVFVDPVQEADRIFEAKLTKAVQARKKSVTSSPFTSSHTPYLKKDKETKRAAGERDQLHSASTVGKYLMKKRR